MPVTSPMPHPVHWGRLVESKGRSVLHRLAPEMRSMRLGPSRLFERVDEVHDGGLVDGLVASPNADLGQVGSSTLTAHSSRSPIYECSVQMLLQAGC